MPQLPRRPAGGVRTTRSNGCRLLSAPASEPRLPLAGLLVLAALIFMSITSEVLPTGLLPEMAADLAVSPSQIGLTVTVFAGTVVIFTTPMSILTGRFRRKRLLVVVLLIFVLSNVLVALAPSYPVLIAARILGGLVHGLFWTVVGAYAAYLVPPSQLGRAVAIAGGGGTAAFVLGVPLGTALGHAVGWRIAFVVIAGVMLLLTLATVRLLPAVSHGVPLATGEIALPLRRDRTIAGVAFVGIVIVVIALAQNTFTTYLVPFLIERVGVSPDAVAGWLFLYGGAGIVGLVYAGTIGQRHARPALVGAVAALGLAVLVVGTAAGVPWVILPTVALWGAAYGAVPPMLQARILHAASLRLRDTASAYFTTTFNAAIALGALVGGVLLDRVGVAVLPLVDAVLLALALMLLLIGDRWLARRA